MRYPIDNARSYTRAKLHTGEIVETNSRSTLRKAVLKRLTEMGEPPANLDAYFANAICEALSEQRAAAECKFVVPGEAPSELLEERRVRSDDIWRFLEFAKNLVTQGAKLVDQEEANRRAAICSQCPKAGHVTGCLGCAGLSGVAMSVVGGRSTPYDDKKQCLVCGCDNSAQVWFELDLMPVVPGVPEWCWKKR